MNKKSWLLTVVGRAVLVIIAGGFGMAVISAKFGLPSTRTSEGIFLVAGLVLPTLLAAYWMFRKLQMRHPRHEARSVAIAFAVTAAVALAAGMLFGDITGGYGALLLAAPFGLAGALVGVVLGVTAVTTFLSFLAVLFAFWLKRHA
jgi:hypothetical protein